MKQMCLRAVVFAMLLIAPFASGRAQLGIDKNRETYSPDQQFGIGINNAGLHIQYAMGPAFHLGMNLNLDLDSRDGFQENIYHFGPYAKFIFSGGLIKPYLMGAVGVLKPGTGKFGIQGRKGLPDSVFVKLPDGQLSIRLAAGTEHFFSQNLGLYGHINLFNAVLSPAPSTFSLGLIGAVAGMEFFF